MSQVFMETLRSPVLKDWLNRRYLGVAKMESLKKSFWRRRPFPHLECVNFLKRDKARRLLGAVMKQRFKKIKERKRAYYYTDEFPLLAFFSSPQFVTYVRHLTGLNLSGRIQTEARLYGRGHFLTLHQDQAPDSQSGGGSAFIVLYLSNFKRKEGGRLNLYRRRSGKGLVIAKSIVPRFNKLALLLIAPRNFHEVDPVRVDKPRYTVCGYLGGDHSPSVLGR